MTLLTGTPAVPAATPTTLPAVLPAAPPALRQLRGHRFLHRLVPTAPANDSHESRPLPVHPNTVIGSTTTLPDEAKRKTAHMLRIIIEVIDGRRPTRQLRKLPLTPLVRAAIETRIRAQLHTTGSRLGRVHFQPMPTAVMAKTDRPEATAVEFCGTWAQHRRVRAFAGRIEKQRGTWTVTALRFI
ncbi:Rv3235 family protein [Corynebacterium ulceribovis]|uniref:Rv3235 family protein n=1 Tax=Corynebacterium ulceribovis TaxID=487732 RepID=UPI00036C99BA|nr:Rv3235 family protein [Corynebacterium ulceribovis]